jgi:secreted trypsin-like serine protease
MIDPNSVLTAAHCFRGLTNRRVQQIYVRVGATRLGRGVQRDVLRVWIHGGFNLHPNSNDMKYDVAVITLKKRVSNARFVALANPSQNYFENPGRMATVVGWGWTQRGSGPVSSVLREVHAIQLRSDQDGEAVWDQHFARALMIAAGTQKRGANNGDSGGPLLVADPSGKYWQIGISSFVNNNRIRQYACDYTNWVRCYDVFTEVNNRSITNFILSSSTR